MKNALLMGIEWNSMLPPAETPAHTEGYEGFYHLMHMQGDEEKTVLAYIIRDHDAVKFDERKTTVQRITNYLNLKYGEGSFICEVKDSYRNMKEKLEPCMYIVDKAEAAFRACGVEPIKTPIRGGTDGARLSYMGLPCPNLSTGGYNFHGRKELITVEAMEKMVDVLETIVRHA
jgi:tripeptide aminopeptidase